MFSRICFCVPFPKATMETTAAIPIITPSIVKNVRIRCAFIDNKAMRKASWKRSRNDLNIPIFLLLTTSVATSSACPVATSVGWFGLSDKISPSLISIIRSAFFATDISCVTIMIVRPSAWISSRMRKTSSPLWLSSAPVGSSARITSPLFINARAIETRCC